MILFSSKIFGFLIASSNALKNSSLSLTMCPALFSGDRTNSFPRKGVSRNIVGLFRRHDNDEF